VRVTNSSSNLHSLNVSAAVLSRGARGATVADLQSRLKAAGFDPGGVDGDFGPQTRTAVIAFQQANGLNADGVVGPKTWAALGAASTTPTTTPTTPTVPVDSFEPATGTTYAARGTGYYPDASAMEGGFVDRQGKPLATLQDFLAGRSSYVSVAMDSNAFPYGTHLRIPELEQKYGRKIDFRAVDTGGAFKGKGTSRIDICTANRSASLDSTINGPLHLVVP
jgi:peptidoglycan hydrolase-like protein with peptidoglycan-binding domain